MACTTDGNPAARRGGATNPKGKIMESKWYDDHEKVKRLAKWLVSGNEFATQTDLLYFFEKPWKWDEEWQEMIGEPVSQ